MYNIELVGTVYTQQFFRKMATLSLFQKLRYQTYGGKYTIVSQHTLYMTEIFQDSA